MSLVNRYQGARTRVGTLTFPFSDEWVDLFRQDGKYYTSHPLLRGPYDGPQDVHRAASRLFRNRSRRQVLKKDRPRSVRRWACRAIRGASPGVTKDLQRSPATPSDKLVAAVAESASTLTLQQADVSSLVESPDTTSLEESITASPRTVPHNTIGSSLSSSPFSCEKCVATSPESSCAERDVSSSEELLDPTSTEEPLIATPEILLHKTVDSSSNSSPFSCEKIVAGVAESALAQTLKESDVPSLDEFLDATLTEVTASPQAEVHDPIDGSSSTVAGAVESACMVPEGSTTGSPQSVLDNTTDGSPSSPSPSIASLGILLNKTIDTTPLEESISASPGIVPHNIIDASWRSSTVSCEKLEAVASESASAQSLKEADASSLEELINSASLEDWTGGNQQTLLHNTSNSTLPSASSLGSKILSRCLPQWFYHYYIRMDYRGSFRIYPDLGGPFQSLQDAEDAISRRLDELRRQAWSNVEGAPDGGPHSPSRTNDDEDRYLIEALLDQYNEDNNLFGNLAYELENVVMEQWIYENHSWYYHYNFTTKKNEAGDISLGACTFFAELSHKHGEDALEVNCCCKIDDEDNGQCYGCRNNGSHGMRHPKNSDAYTGGHLDVFLPFDFEEPSSSDEEDTEERRLRNTFEDNPRLSLSRSSSDEEDIFDTRLMNLFEDNPRSSLSRSLFQQQESSVEV